MTAATTIDINGALEQRGLLEVAGRAGWTPYALNKDGVQYRGWSYPVYKVDGTEYDRPRWKSAEPNGNGPKYYWPQGQPDRSKYYYLPGLLSAIQENNHQLYIAGGEPDVLAYHASGIKNVLCWLAAEISIPVTLVRDLAYMGVRSVVYAPDRDAAGMRSAAKLAEMLAETEIYTFFSALPGEIGSKFDVNDLLVQCGGDADRFLAGIWGAGIDPVDLHIYAQQRGKTSEQGQQDFVTLVSDWRDEWYTIIQNAMGNPHTTSGGTGFWRCPLPHRHKGGDHRPSFRFSTTQNADHPWPVCSCDIQSESDPWGMVADALGLDGWNEYKRRKAAESGFDGSRPAQPASGLNGIGQFDAPKPVIVSMVSAYEELLSELEMKTQPPGTPIRFPYQVLHRFDGFADFLWTGKSVAIHGISGGGKTMLLRCLFTALINQGWDVAWWGPEFSPNEYAVQDTQRLGGLNFRQINQFRVIRALMRDEALSMEDAIRESGLSMPGDQALERAKSILRKLMQQPGEMFVIPDPEMPIDEVMGIVKDWAETGRKEGKKRAAFGLDYIQLANMRGRRDSSWYEQVIGYVKNSVSPAAANLVAFLTTQTRKDDAAQVREHGDQLKLSSAQWISDQKINLYLTLTPVYENEQKQNRAIIGVAKNSMGATGNVEVYAEWSRLAILDKEVEKQNINTMTDYPHDARGGDS